MHHRSRAIIRREIRFLTTKTIVFFSTIAIKCNANSVQISSNWFAILLSSDTLKTFCRCAHETTSFFNRMRRMLNYMNIFITSKYGIVVERTNFFHQQNEWNSLSDGNKWNKDYNRLWTFLLFFMTSASIPKWKITVQKSSMESTRKFVCVIHVKQNNVVIINKLQWGFMEQRKRHKCDAFRI